MKWLPCVSAWLRGFITLNYWIISGHPATTSDLFFLHLSYFLIWSCSGPPKGARFPTVGVSVPLLVWEVNTSSNWCLLQKHPFFAKLVEGPRASFLCAVSQTKSGICSDPSGQQSLGRARGTACDDNPCPTSLQAGRTGTSLSLSIHPLQELALSL